MAGQDPAIAQTNGRTNYFARPGQALVNAAIVSSTSIKSLNQVGLSQQSEVNAGYNYRSFDAGLQPVRAGSSIGHYRQRGDLVDSVVSSTFRPNNHVYATGTAGPGVIKGNLHGRLYTTGAPTVLGNYGAGIFAKHKIGYLPPPEGPLRFKSVATR